MKNRFFLIGFLVFSFFYSKAQDAFRKQEFQVSLDILDGIKNTNIYYKVGVKDKKDKFWRARLGRTTSYYNNTATNLYLYQNFLSGGFGYEYRMPVIRKSMFTVGIEPFGSIWTSKEDLRAGKKAGSMIWSAGIGFPIGLIINGSAEWFVAFETIPSFFYQAVGKDEYGIYQQEKNSVNFSQYNFALCFGYRIPTKRI